jgi:hypothetical protein
MQDKLSSLSSVEPVSRSPELADGKRVCEVRILPETLSTACWDPPRVTRRALGSQESTVSKPLTSTALWVWLVTLQGVRTTAVACGHSYACRRVLKQIRLQQ